MLKRVKFRLLKVGATTHFEWLTARGGGWRRVPFPALCALIEHPDRGMILYDTGYAQHFLSATSRLPERLYREFLPVALCEKEALLSQLSALGSGPHDIHTLLISHFHGDHIAGLRDFPRARFVAMRADAERALSFSRVRGLLNGFLPALLPEDFGKRLGFADDNPAVALPTWMAPFTYGYDLFGDQSVLAVPLPGHSDCQMGLLLCDETDRVRFLVADACWSVGACRDGCPPSFLANLVFADVAQYRNTFFALRTLATREPSLCLIPSHCLATWKAIEACDA